MDLQKFRDGTLSSIADASPYIVTLLGPTKPLNPQPQTLNPKPQTLKP